MQHAEVLSALVDFDESRRLMVIMLSGSLLFYAVIRSGLNERVASDPSLTLAQTAFGVLGSAGGYAAGPARGAVISHS